MHAFGMAESRNSILILRSCHLRPFLRRSESLSQCVRQGQDRVKGDLPAGRLIPPREDESARADDAGERESFPWPPFVDFEGAFDRIADPVRGLAVEILMTPKGVIAHELMRWLCEGRPRPSSSSAVEQALHGPCSPQSQ